MEIDWQKVMKEKPKMKSYSVYLDEELVTSVRKKLDNNSLSRIINNIFKQLEDSHKP